MPTGAGFPRKSKTRLSSSVAEAQQSSEVSRYDGSSAMMMCNVPSWAKTKRRVGKLNKVALVCVITLPLLQVGAQIAKR